MRRLAGSTLHVTSNVTPITHLLHGSPFREGKKGGRRRRGRATCSFASNKTIHSLRYIPLYASLFILHPPPRLLHILPAVTSRLSWNNPRHRQVCEGMNEKLQGGLAKFLLRLPRPTPPSRRIRSLRNR